MINELVHLVFNNRHSVKSHLSLRCNNTDHRKIKQNLQKKKNQKILPITN